MIDKQKNLSGVRDTVPVVLSLKEELENNIENLIELARDRIGYSSSLMKALMSSIEKLRTKPESIQLKAMDFFQSVVLSTRTFSDASLLAAAKASNKNV